MPLFLLSFLGGAKSFLSAAFTFLTTKPGVYLLIAGLAAGAYWWSGHQGYNRGVAQERSDEALRLADARTKAAAEGARVQHALDQGVSSAATKTATATAKAVIRTITITKEIPHYVTVEVDRSFPLPCSLIRVHDAAALGVDPQTLDNPSGLADGAACPVKASDLAETINENYGLDHQKDAQILGLQELVKTLDQQLTGKPPVIEEPAQ